LPDLVIIKLGEIIMELYINNTKVDYKLNEEKSLLDIVEGLKNWVKSEGGFIKEILVNGEDIDNTSNLDISDIKRIDVYVSSGFEEVNNVIPTLKDYITRFINTIDTPSFSSDKNEKIEGILWIIDAFNLSVQSLKLKSSYIFYNGKNLEETLNFLSFSLKTIIENIHNDRFFNAYFSEGIKQKLQDLLSYLDRILDFYSYITGKSSIFIDSVKKEIDIFKDSISNIVIMLNNGNDKDALLGIQRLLKFFEFLTLSLSVINIDVNEIQDCIIDSFNKLYEFFKDRDYVSVIDILEYEIIPKIDEIKSFFSKVS